MPIKKTLTHQLLALAIILVSLNPLFGQSGKILGTVTDEQSLPVPYASIAVKDNASQVFLGTISDLQGNFTLTLPEQYNDDTVRISCVGFETLYMPIKQLTLNTKQNFRLQQSTTTLQTVLFQDLTAKQLLTECIKKISANYRNVSFSNNAFYWKAVTEDSTCVAFEESMMSIREDHSLTRSDRTFTYDSIIHKGDTLAPLIPFDNIEALFYFDFIRTGSGVTNPDNLDEWKFEYLTLDTEQFGNATPIKATRKDNLGEFLVYINSEDYSFLRVEFSYRWPSNLHSLDNSLYYNLKNVDGIVQYQKTKDKYSIKYLYTTFTYSTYAQHTFKKLFTRTTDFEFTLLSSLEMKYGSHHPKVNRTSVNTTPVIVNTERYCKALAAFGGSEFCK